MKLTFYISEYIDGTFEIETKHMHYTFRDDLNFDNVKAGDIIKIMKQITETLKAENIKPQFICK